MEKSNREIDKGFTLVELLATVGIIAVVFGLATYFALNTINKSKSEADVIAMNNIKRIASVYSEEYPENVIWQDGEDGSKKTCVPVEMLVNKGYLKKKDIKNVNLEFVLLEKNEQNSIVKEELDETTFCSEMYGQLKVELPSKGKVCADVVYDGIGKILLNTDMDDEWARKLIFDGPGTDGENKVKDAGDYKIGVRLNEGYVWSDYTKDEKEVTCKIKKATPKLSFTPDHIKGEDATVGKHEKEIILTSSVSGSILLATSNMDYAVASSASKVELPSGEENVGIPVTLEILSVRKYDTVITATLKPEDSKNYKTVKAEFLIGNPQRGKVKIPNSDDNCNNVPYDGEKHNITKDLDNKYDVSGHMATEVGEYKITAKLHYGYEWDMKTAKGKDIAPTADVTFNCKITPQYKIIYHANGGTGEMETQEVSVGDSVTIQDNKFIRENYKFDGWTIRSDGTRDPIKNNDWTGWSGTWMPHYKNGYAGIENNELNLYAMWKPTYITLTYDDNGGSGCGGQTKIVKNGEEYGDLCTPSNGDNWFLGWFDEDPYKNKPLNYYADENLDISNNYCKKLTGDGYDPSCLFGHYRAYGIKEYEEAIKKGEKSSRRSSQYLASDTVDRDGDFTLYAGWTSNIWSITLDKDGGSGGTGNVLYKQNSTSKINGTTCYYFTSYALDNCVSRGYYVTPPTKSGYKFLGYYTEKNGKGTQYVDKDGQFINNIYKQAGNKTLYAYWEQIKCSVGNTAGCETMYVCKRGGPQANIGTGTTFIHHTTSYGVSGCTMANAEWCNTLKSGSTIKILGESAGFYHVYVVNDSSFVSRNSDGSLWPNGTNYGYIWKNCLNKDRNVNCYDTSVYGCYG